MKNNVEHCGKVCVPAVAPMLLYYCRPSGLVERSKPHVTNMKYCNISTAVAFCRPLEVLVEPYRTRQCIQHTPGSAVTAAAAAGAATTLMGRAAAGHQSQQQCQGEQQLQQQQHVLAVAFVSPPERCIRPGLPPPSRCASPVGSW